MSRKRTGDRGAAGELLVSAALLADGYSVYRSVSPSAPFDLVAYRDGDFLRIEVRCTKRRLDGTVSPRIRPLDQCDIYALVDTEGEIEYQGSAQQDTIWKDYRRPRTLDNNYWASDGQDEELQPMQPDSTFLPESA